MPRKREWAPAIIFASNYEAIIITTISRPWITTACDWLRHACHCICTVVWNTECSPERGPEWAGMRLRHVWLESAQERPWKPGVLRPGSAFWPESADWADVPYLCVEEECVLGLCIGRVSDLDPRVRIPPVCVESATNRVVCDGAVCADVRCVWSSTVFWAYKGRMATVSGVHCR